MLNNPQKEFSEQEVLNYYKQHYKTKICTEIVFEGTIDEKLLKLYQKYKKTHCCIKPLSLMIYSIIILAFTCAGFYFTISENEGYKAFKEVLERNISLINVDLPHEYETVKLLSYLNRPQEEGVFCSYIEYSLDKCDLGSYREFCTSDRFSEGKCNYMDRQYNLGYTFTCNLANYQNGYCSQVQYIDYLEQTQGESYEPKISFFDNYTQVNITSFVFEKIWCSIGDYDRPIFLSFIILLGLFIVFLIFDMAINKKTLTPGVKYYIIVSVYMLYYVIFRIYTILFFVLIFYGMLVSLDYPTTEDDVYDPFFDKNQTIYSDEEKKWKDDRIYAFIFCGICLILFIMVMILGLYKKLIHNYLLFNFDDKNVENNNENNNIIVKRNASIKIGKNSYDFGIRQNKDLYLRENRTNKKFYFKEVFFGDEIYYLKFSNIGLKDQLGWNEFKFPYINDIFVKLSQLLIFIIVIAYFIIAISVWKMKNDITYDYFLQLIDLGYQPKYYKYLEKSDDLNSSFDNYILYIYLILGIFIMLSLAKYAFFGGFKNMVFNWIGLFIAIIITLLNLVSFVLSIIGFIYNLLGFYCYVSKNDIQFETETILIKLMLRYSFYFYIFIFSLVSFIISIGLITSINNIKAGNLKLETENKTSEDLFKYISLDNENLILEAVNNNNNLPKHLFYAKKINPNPIPTLIFTSIKQTDSILCLERNNEEILEEKEKTLLQNYKYKAFNTKRIISRIIMQIIMSSITIIFIIVTLSYSFKGNVYYKAYSDYLIQFDDYLSTGIISLNSALPTYTKFWAEFGNSENALLISFLIFVILFLCFEIFSLLLHKIVIKIDYQNGIFYKLILYINIVFFVLFKIYLPLIIFSFIYSIIVLFGSPHNSADRYSFIFGNGGEEFLNDQWNKKKYILIVNIVMKLFVLAFLGYLLNVKYAIIEYLNKNYEESEDDEDEENNKKEIEKNEIITTINIDNTDYYTRIKLNETLYLTQIGENVKERIFTFKKIVIQNFTPNFVFARLGPDIITDQISNSQWDYPNFNHIFLKLGDMCDWIYMILFFSLPLFELHVKKELAYDEIHIVYSTNKLLGGKKLLFADIFDIYGEFEQGLTNSRFTLYVIQLAFIFSFMLKRIQNGGFKKSCNLIVVFVIDIIFLIQNIVYIILDFLLILFNLFAIICYYKNKYNLLADDMLDAKLFLQLIINIDILRFNIQLLKENSTLTTYLNQLRKAMDKFNKKEDNINEDEPNFKPVEFKYVSLDGNICILKEFQNNLIQRYLLYIPENEQIGKDNNLQIMQKQENDVMVHKKYNNYEQIMVNNTIGAKENNDENIPSTEKNLK